MAQLTTQDLLALINAGGGGGATQLGAGDYLGPLLTGGYSLYQGAGGGDISHAREAAALADPFASQRPAYQNKLMDLLTNPGSFSGTPGYQFAVSQGQDAIKGAGNAIYGGTRAGAIYPELAKFTEGYANQDYDTRINQLLTAAGATSGSPGTAGALLAGGFQNQNQDIGSGLSNALLGLLGGRALGAGGSDGIIGLLGKILNPSSSGGLPNVTGTNTIGGGSTPLNSLIGGGSGATVLSGSGESDWNNFNPNAGNDLGGDNWFNDMFGNGGGSNDWLNSLYGGG